MRTRTHGKPSTYIAGCRCRPCTDANALRQRRRRWPLKHGAENARLRGALMQMLVQQS